MEVVVIALKPLRPCRKVGCSELTRTGYCEKHRPLSIPKRQVSAQWHRLYGLPIWARLRSRQLVKEPFCRSCAKFGLRTTATEVDHITPHEGDMTVFTAEDNLQSLCSRCHKAKTMRELNKKLRQKH